MEINAERMTRNGLPLVVLRSFSFCVLRGVGFLIGLYDFFVARLCLLDFSQCLLQV